MLWWRAVNSFTYTSTLLSQGPAILFDLLSSEGLNIIKVVLSWHRKSFCTFNYHGRVEVKRSKFRIVISVEQSNACRWKGHHSINFSHLITIFHCQWVKGEMRDGVFLCTRSSRRSRLLNFDFRITFKLSPRKNANFCSKMQKPAVKCIGRIYINSALWNAKYICGYLEIFAVESWNINLFSCKSLQELFTRNCCTAIEFFSRI